MQEEETVERVMKTKDRFIRVCVDFRWMYWDDGFVVMEQMPHKRQTCVLKTDMLSTALDALLEESWNG
jgi:hypothetical protein